MSRAIGIVVIGRNEGERLVQSLESICCAGPVVYVDSGSTDGSAERVQTLGVAVVRLDLSRPFTAARARNAGFALLQQMEPNLTFVQFLDGDTTLAPNWLESAVRAFDADENLAIVCGRLREQFPDKSVFNRLADLEWDAPSGEISSCGGIFMARAREFAELEGFREDVVAGEEPELCSRVVEHGWKIRRIAEPMGYHDIAMTRFSQWWQRQLRAGYGGLYTFQQCAGRTTRPFTSQIRSARIWTLAWPATLASAAVIGGMNAGLLGAILMSATIFAAIPVQIIRLARRRAQQGDRFRHAFLYAAFVMLAKIPQMCGQIRWIREKHRGISATLIEHR